MATSETASGTAPLDSERRRTSAAHGHDFKAIVPQSLGHALGGEILDVAGAITRSEHRDAIGEQEHGESDGGADVGEGEQQFATKLQHAIHFAERPISVGQMLDALGAHHDVELAVVVRDFILVHIAGRDSLVAVGQCVVEIFGADVNAVNLMDVRH